jgi:hypothetical protein
MTYHLKVGSMCDKDQIIELTVKEGAHICLWSAGGERCRGKEARGYLPRYQPARLRSGYSSFNGTGGSEIYYLSVLWLLSSEAGQGNEITSCTRGMPPV